MDNRRRRRASRLTDGYEIAAEPNALKAPPARRVTEHSDHLAGVTQPGRVGRVNQDGLHIADDGRMWVIADGMGGEAAGEVATEMVLKECAEMPRFSSDIVASADDVEAALRAAFDIAQRAILGRGERDSKYRGMGCAALAAMLVGSELFVCHVGDVRCYTLCGDSLELLTQDHTTVARLVSLGVLTMDQGRLSPERSRLDQAIGIAHGFRPTILRCAIPSGAVVLTCTDGVWGALDEPSLFHTLRASSCARECAVTIVDAATKAGGSDDMTALVYQHPE